MDRHIAEEGQFIVGKSREGLYVEVPSSSPTLKGWLMLSYLLTSTFSLVESLPNVVNFILSQGSLS